MAWEIPDEELTDRVEVGAGAFGVVMRTRWRGTVIAMKQLHRHLHHDEVAKAEFRTELYVTAFPKSQHCLPIVQSNYSRTSRKTDPFLFTLAEN
jgi:hypothetical protein